MAPSSFLDSWAHPRRRRRLRRLRPHLLLSAALFLAAGLAFLGGLSAVLRGANSLGRQCSAISGGLPGELRTPRIAMVTLFSDHSGASSPGRSFRGVMAAAGGNKQAYAAAKGYDFEEHEAAAIDRTRPPSWSKILAVRARLPRYDWVFWNDADTLVTNPDISLESILFSVIGHTNFQAAPDLVVTEDFNGVNSGVFFVRRSEWTLWFLDTWWNHTSFVQFGSTRSGDNAALKHLLDHLPPEELQTHVHVAPMQCLFNSYPWRPTWKSVFRLFCSPQTTWKGVYSEGDFMIHFAGLDDKSGWTSKILREMRTQ